MLITLSPAVKYDTVYSLLQKILEVGLIVNVKYHKTTHEYAFYITSSYETLLHGAEAAELKKIIKSEYGGGVKEFIFDEQEFYENIEDEDLFLNTQEKQSIILEILNSIKCDTDLEEIVLNGRKVPNGRKLSNYKICFSLFFYSVTDF